jgi:hypothetical protein
MEDWRLEKSTEFLVRDIAMKVSDEKFALKLFSVADRLNEFANEDLEDIERLKLRADTLEQFGLNAHGSILKDSLFLIVPLIAYILLNRVR